jgi:predicted ATPase
LGKYGDILTEGTESDVVSVTVVENSKEYQWVFGGPIGANQVPFSKVPDPQADFVTTPHFQFLHADRIVPQTLYPQAPQTSLATGFLGTRGEYTIDFLNSAANRSVPKQRTFPRTGLGINEELLNKVAPTDGLPDQVVGWLQQLSPGSRLISDPVVGTDEVLLKYRYEGRTREVSSNFYRPTNVGFGLTYSLPIIVACLAAPKGALILMENPEAHLHPQGQSALGELLARCANDGVQIIVETHSDHLLNGVRLSVKRKIIDKGNVALHFFSRSVETGDASVETPAVMDNGRLSNWPRGFFDQWDKDVETLLD